MDVRGSLATVWAAFTTSVALDKWCAPHAAIDARPGGVLRANVDRVTEIEAVIDVLIPERRMRLIHLSSAALPPTDHTLVDDLVLEARAHTTVVRLLGSGIPSDPAWDAIYLCRRRGWEHALARLKAYVERESVRSVAP